MFKDNGIILNATVNKDYDKTLTVLFENRGKAYLYAKGAKKPQSKLAAAVELFSVSEFVVYEGNGFLSVTQAQLIDNRYQVRNDYGIFCYACYMAELCDKIMKPEMESAEVYALLNRAFEAFCKTNINSRFVFTVFLLKLMKLEGYMPELDFCSSCSDISERYRFGQSGLVCPSCVTNAFGLTDIDAETIDGLKYIYFSDVHTLFKQNSRKELLNNLYKTALFFTEANLDIKLKSRELIY